MESSLKNMVLTLFAITLVSATALSVVYNMTKGPIEESKKAKTVSALAGVLPEFDNNPAENIKTIEIDGLPAKIYTAQKGDDVVGYAVETVTKQGFSGEIKMMVGFTANGEIKNIEVLEHNETPGLGSKMADEGNPLLVSFMGKNPADLKMSVKKDGGDIDVITASTISSRAYTDAVDRAYRVFQSAVLGMEVEEQEQVDPFEVVLPEYNNKIAKTARKTTVNGVECVVYTAKQKRNTVGYAVETSAEGYHGKINMFVGYTPNREIYNICLTEHGESGKFRAAMEDENNPFVVSLKGKNPLKTNMKLVADGGEIDVISGSTVSVTACIEAIKTSSEALSKIIGEDKK